MSGGFLTPAEEAAAQQAVARRRTVAAADLGEAQKAAEVAAPPGAAPTGQKELPRGQAACAEEAAGASAGGRASLSRFSLSPLLAGLHNHSQGRDGTAAAQAAAGGRAAASAAPGTPDADASDRSVSGAAAGLDAPCEQAAPQPAPQAAPERPALPQQAPPLPPRVPRPTPAEVPARGEDGGTAQPGAGEPASPASAPLAAALAARQPEAASAAAQAPSAEAAAMTAESTIPSSGTSSLGEVAQTSAAAQKLAEASSKDSSSLGSSYGFDDAGSVRQLAITAPAAAPPPAAHLQPSRRHRQQQQDVEPAHGAPVSAPRQLLLSAPPPAPPPMLLPPLAPAQQAAALAWQPFYVAQPAQCSKPQLDSEPPAKKRAAAASAQRQPEASEPQHQQRQKQQRRGKPPLRDSLKGQLRPAAAARLGGAMPSVGGDSSSNKFGSDSDADAGNDTIKTYRPARAENPGALHSMLHCNSAGQVVAAFNISLFLVVFARSGRRLCSRNWSSGVLAITMEVTAPFPVPIAVSELLRAAWRSFGEAAGRGAQTERRRLRVHVAGEEQRRHRRPQGRSQVKAHVGCCQGGCRAAGAGGSRSAGIPGRRRHQERQRGRAARRRLGRAGGQRRWRRPEAAHPGAAHGNGPRFGGIGARRPRRWRAAHRHRELGAGGRGFGAARRGNGRCPAASCSSGAGRLELQPGGGEPASAGSSIGAQIGPAGLLQKGECTGFESFAVCQLLRGQPQSKAPGTALVMPSRSVVCVRLCSCQAWTCASCRAVVQCQGVATA